MLVASTVWRRRAQLVPARGMGVRADIERMRDVPRVRVSELTVTGPECAQLTLTAAGADGGDLPDAPEPAEGRVELVFPIEIAESESGFEILSDWRERQCVLGVVLPGDSHLIRLRCLEDLQPLTLRRLDSGS
jgi:hypothetical protein